MSRRSGQDLSFRLHSGAGSGRAGEAVQLEQTAGREARGASRVGSRRRAGGGAVSAEETSVQAGKALTLEEVNRTSPHGTATEESAGCLSGRKDGRREEGLQERARRRGSPRSTARRGRVLKEGRLPNLCPAKASPE